MKFAEYLALGFACLVGVYVFFRLVFTAYYNAKKEYHKNGAQVQVPSEKE